MIGKAKFSAICVELWRIVSCIHQIVQAGHTLHTHLCKRYSRLCIVHLSRSENSTDSAFILKRKVQRRSNTWSSNSTNLSYPRRLMRLLQISLLEWISGIVQCWQTCQRMIFCHCNLHWVCTLNSRWRYGQSMRLLKYPAFKFAKRKDLMSPTRQR